VEFEILELTLATTSVIPDSIKSFVGREQMLGMLSEKTNKTFDMFGLLKQSLIQRQNTLTENANKDKE